jgi:single-stranded-DNA-specific exonuclease
MPPAAVSTPVWGLHPRRSPERAAELARALGAPLPVAHALVNRGLDTHEKAIRFLEPALEDLHDPREMLDLERAATRILAAVAAGELLYSALEELGARLEHRIPHRIKDGYGLSLEAIEEAKRRACTLVVTVDCGITAHDAVALANTYGIDTVITDHHEPQATLPAAFAIVNPLRPGCPYPFKSLAGVGVTFKLVERLLRGRGGIDRAREYLDVVALGTIADVVPLVGENRILARIGLDTLNLGKRLGLRALVEVAGLSGKRISSGQVAFVLAPRINAAGRMGNAEQGLRLLMARDASEARDCAASLEDDNERRRKFDEAALIEAAQRVEAELNYPACCSILLWSDKWHPGVIGIVASRLVERFQRPTVLVALDGERGRGSGRSLPGLDLTRLLDGCGDLLLAHGGHAFAAGLTVARENLPELRVRMERLVSEQYRPDQFLQRLDVDSEIRLAECDEDLVGWLERMAPHGLDNSEPLFQLRDAEVCKVTRVGKDKHVRFNVRDGACEVEAIGFGMGDQAAALSRAGRADLVFVPTRNEWKNEMRVQLKLKAMKLP